MIGHSMISKKMNYEATCKDELDQSYVPDATHEFVLSVASK